LNGAITKFSQSGDQTEANPNPSIAVAIHFRTIRINFGSLAGCQQQHIIFEFFLFVLLS
jgi:hypothetical protein